jgi:hypothetical protein
MGSYSTNLCIVRAMRYDISYGSYDTTYVRHTISVSRLKTARPEFRSRDPYALLQCLSPFWCATTGISGSGHRNPEFRPKRTTKLWVQSNQPNQPTAVARLRFALSAHTTRSDRNLPLRKCCWYVSTYDENHNLDFRPRTPQTRWGHLGAEVPHLGPSQVCYLVFSPSWDGFTHLKTQVWCTSVCMSSLMEL